MLTIITTYKKNAKGAGQIVARSGNKQKTVPYDHERSAAYNHGAAAAALGNRVIPTGSLNKAQRTAKHVDLGDGKHRFSFEV